MILRVRAGAPAFLLGLFLSPSPTLLQGAERYRPGPAAAFSQILGRPTDRSATLSVLSAAAADVYVEYGQAGGERKERTKAQRAEAGVPLEIPLERLEPQREYLYRAMVRKVASGEFEPAPAGTFRTCPASGATFRFGVQGDSHPERAGKMYDPDLYQVALGNAATDKLDHYFMLGDDFSIERLISRNALTQPAVDEVYAHQRGFLDAVGRTGALFLVNGNHEQAARYTLNGTDRSPGVLAARARTRFFPLPAPDPFYSGDQETVEHIGLLRDYYSWTWGDALFLVIDPYWHSPVAVDNEAGTGPEKVGEKGGKKAGGGKGNRDLWNVTLGDAQYKWFQDTLQKSTARWKFVFAHHVQGTGRGAIENAHLYEWGGHDRRGEYLFEQKRPGWDLPIHALMVKHGVSIFFQGHDHLYARQQLDGIVYQECPNPADRTYTAFNREAYTSGHILPNSGHLRVTVAPEKVTVEYVLAVHSADESEQRKNRQVAHRYELKATAASRPSSPKEPRK